METNTLADGCLWIWKPYLPLLTSVMNDERVVITTDCAEQLGDNLTIVGDIVVHVDTSKVSGAWQLYKEQDSKRQVA